MVSIAESITAYMTFVSRCGMSPAYSEYLFYGPIVQTAADKGWDIKTEVTVERTGKRGDNPKIDFYFDHTNYSQLAIAMEVKYIHVKKKRKNDVVSIVNDLVKLRGLVNNELCKGKQLFRFVILIGDHTERAENKNGYKLPKNLPRVDGLDDNVKEYYQTFYHTRYTDYGCTVLEAT